MTMSEIIELRFNNKIFVNTKLIFSQKHKRITYAVSPSQKHILNQGEEVGILLTILQRGKCVIVFFSLHEQFDLTRVNAVLFSLKSNKFFKINFNFCPTSNMNTLVKKQQPIPSSVLPSLSKLPRELYQSIYRTITMNLKDFTNASQGRRMSLFHFDL